MKLEDNRSLKNVPISFVLLVNVGLITCGTIISTLAVWLYQYQVYVSGLSEAVGRAVKIDNFIS